MLEDGTESEKVRDAVSSLHFEPTTPLMLQSKKDIQKELSDIYSDSSEIQEPQEQQVEKKLPSIPSTSTIPTLQSKIASKQLDSSNTVQKKKGLRPSGNTINTTVIRVSSNGTNLTKKEKSGIVPLTMTASTGTTTTTVSGSKLVPNRKPTHSALLDKENIGIKKLTTSSLTSTSTSSLGKSMAYRLR